MDRSNIGIFQIGRNDIKVTAPMDIRALDDLEARQVLEDPGNPYRMGTAIAQHRDWTTIYHVLCTTPDVFNSHKRFTGGPRAAPFFWVLIVAPDDHEPLFYGRLQWRRDLDALELYW
jgi:hypothetical protein